MGADMIIVFDKKTKNIIGYATQVFDSGRWREATVQELYPNVNPDEVSFVYIKESVKYGIHPDPAAWQIKFDENGAPVGIERKPAPPKIHLTTNAQDTDRDGFPELAADGKSKATITVEVKDAKGKLVKDDFILAFKTTGGSLSARRVETKGGKAKVTLTSSVETVTATVSASGEGVQEASLTFEFMPPQ